MIERSLVQGCLLLRVTAMLLVLANLGAVLTAQTGFSDIPLNKNERSP
jgi:hypothetical protein